MLGLGKQLAGLLVGDRAVVSSHAVSPEGW
jgi:hypothetical protein